MHQVPVDVEYGWGAGLRGHNVPIPDLLEQSARLAGICAGSGHSHIPVLSEANGSRRRLNSSSVSVVWDLALPFGPPVVGTGTGSMSSSARMWSARSPQPL